MLSIAILCAQLHFILRNRISKFGKPPNRPFGENHNLLVSQLPVENSSSPILDGCDVCSIVNSRYAVFGPLFRVLIWPITYRNADENCNEITWNGPLNDPYLASFWVLFDLKSSICDTYDMSFTYMIASRSLMVPWRTPNTHLQNAKMKISTNPMPHNNTGSQNTIFMTLNNPLLYHI